MAFDWQAMMGSGSGGSGGGGGGGQSSSAESDAASDTGDLTQGPKSVTFGLDMDTALPWLIGGGVGFGLLILVGLWILKRGGK